jgi:hypothetical protein
MRSQLTFSFEKTEAAAQALCDAIIKNQSAYMNKHHKPSYHLWTGQDGSQAYLVWYRR